jgi:hypothetical protein
MASNLESTRLISHIVSTINSIIFYHFKQMLAFPETQKQGDSCGNQEIRRPYLNQKNCYCMMMYVFVTGVEWTY